MEPWNTAFELSFFKDLECAPIQTSLTMLYSIQNKLGFVDHDSLKHTGAK